MIFLVYTFILSLLSLLSKGQAVTLPIVFILIDFIWEKQFHWKSLMEKIPFFILSALFGWIAIKAQGAGEAINANYYDNFSSIFFGSYGLLLYLYKFFLPIHLSGLHPYPFSENMKVPGFVYAASVIIPLIVVLTIKTYRTKKVVSFGILFFLFAIAPMLKLLPVGDTIMAERYTYIPYTGLFIIIGWFYNQVESSREWRKYLWPYRIVLGGFVLFFAVATFNRTKVWKDSQSFWGNVVEQYPDYWRGNHCLGYHFYEKGDYAKAYDYFTRAIQRDKYCPPVPYSLRGVVLLEQMKKPDEAIVDFKRVIELSHSPQERLYQEATMNLGLAYHRKGDYVNALQTYEKLMPLIPNDAKLHYHRGLSLAGQQQYSQAIEAYEKSLQLKPDYVDPLLNRGVIYTDNLGNYDLGIKDFKQVLQLQPGNMDAAINIGVALYKKGELDAALSQYNQILEAMPGNGRIYFLRALAWVAKNDLTKALEDAEKAKQLGIAISDDMIASWKRR